MDLLQSDAGAVQVRQATGVDEVGRLARRQAVTDGTRERLGSVAQHPDDPVREGFQQVLVIVGDDRALDWARSWTRRASRAPRPGPPRMGMPLADEAFEQVAEEIVAIAPVSAR